MMKLIAAVLIVLYLNGCTPPSAGSYGASAAYQRQLINRPGLYGGGG